MSKLKKEGAPIHFSYLDIFFLLLLGLFLSLAVYFGSVAAENAKLSEYEVKLSAYVKAPLTEIVPKKGESLYGANGEIVGEILSVEKEAFHQRTLIRLTCRVNLKESPVQGDAMQIETRDCTLKMNVYSVEKEG